MHEKTDMESIIMFDLRSRFRHSNVKGFDDFSREIASTIAQVVSNQREANAAVGIIIENLSIEEREITYGDKYPGVYDHHGFPTAYDIAETEEYLRDNQARALLNDLEMFKVLILERLR